MAEHRRDHADVPELLYHPERPGWKAAALAWLDDHPGRALPVGQHGDRTDVYVIAAENRANLVIGSLNGLERGKAAGLGWIQYPRGCAGDDPPARAGPVWLCGPAPAVHQGPAARPARRHLHADPEQR